MKLTFDQKIKISPIINKNRPVLVNNKLYTQYDNTIVITDSKDCSILDRISFENISCFTVNNGILYVANTNIVLYSLQDKKILDTLTFGKLLINKIEVNDDIYISCIDGSLKKIIKGCAVKLTTFDNSISEMILRGNKILAYDGSTIKLLSGSKTEIEVNKENVKGMDLDSEMYFVTEDGDVYCNNELVMETKKQLDGMFIADDKIVLCGNGMLYIYSKEFELIKLVSLINPSNKSNEIRYIEIKGEKYIDITKYEDSEEQNTVDSSDSDTNSNEFQQQNTESNESNNNSTIDDDSHSNGLTINYISKDFVFSSQNEIFILSNEFTVIGLILGNIDEITSMKQIDDLIVIASSSDRIFYTYRDFYNSGEYVFRGFLLSGHSDVVMFIDLCEDRMVSTSRDATAILWNISLLDKEEIKRTKSEYQNKHNFSIVNKFECGESGQNACAVAQDFIVVGGDNGIIQFFNTSENFITKKIHSKEINCLLIDKNNKLIISASQDKEIKILDYQSKVLHTLLGHRKGVISLSLGSRYLASCSLDKTIRLWDINTWECVSVLEGHDSGVLSTVFYKNDVISASISGGSKIWNLKTKKCESNLVFPSKTWTLFVYREELLVGSSEYLLIFKDETQKKSLEILENETKIAKQKIHVEKCLKNNNFEELLGLIKDSKDYKLLFNTISKTIDGNSNVLDLLSKKQIYKVLQNNQKFKNCVTNNLILQHLFDTKQFAPKEMMEEIKKRTKKELEGVNLIYRRLLSYDIFTDK